MQHHEVISPLFETYIHQHARLNQLGTGYEWAEGPAWFGDAGCLLFSDIPNNRICRWIPGIGMTIYRDPSNFTNGHTRDRNGRLVSCEHGGRRVTRTEHDGTITVIADSFNGKRLNSPNDVVVKSDGSIWFTDPHYGIISNYEGHKADEELPCNVYRVNPETFELSVVASDFGGPNGLAFSPDERRLYISDTGRKHEPDAKRHIRVFDVENGVRLSRGEVFHVVDPGVSDGVRLDTDGNVWTSAGDGVHCLSPDGELLGKILVPEVVSNLCFGGRAKQVLYITATTSVYSIKVDRQGVQWP